MNDFVPFDRSSIEQSVASRFEQQCCLYADDTALQSDCYRLSYSQLNRVANTVGAGLVDACEGTAGSAAILLEHDAQFAVAMLAALKAGITYVPLDPAFPPERLRYMAEDSGAKIILTNQRNLSEAKQLAGEKARVLDLDEATMWPAHDRLGLGIDVHPDTIAYILYTSGSTGEPKGVVQSHRNILHHAAVWTNALGISHRDRMTLVSSFSWDSAVQDVYGALLNGATSFVFDVKSRGYDALVDFVLKNDLTICHFTVPLFRQFAQALRDRGLRTAVRVLGLGADMINESDVNMFAELFPPDSMLVNAYGSTESTTAVIYAVRQGATVPAYPLPIGFPVEATEIDLLDPDGRPVGPGDPGEIVIRSNHVALGYWNKPDLTAEKFKQESGLRSYFTGDLGLRREDGCLVLRGRKDNLVKIRGFRVEPGEIEGVLARHPDVREAVVVALPGPGDGKRLAAYVVATVGRDPTVVDLRGFVAARLPDFMVPAAFVFLDALPLTPNRKIDRRALPEPDWGRRMSAREFVPPRTPVEHVLASIWVDVLGVDRVGAYDNFFELGGDSLNAMEMIALADKRGLALQVWQAFRYPTVAELAAIADGRAAEQAAGSDRDRAISKDWASNVSLEAVQRRLAHGVQCEQAFPLTRTQLGIYFCCVLGLGEPGAYVEQAWYRLSGDLDLDAFVRTWHAVVERHAALRSGFMRAGGSTVAQFVAKGLRSDVDVVDSSEVDEKGQHSFLRRYCRETLEKPFKFSSPPLFRVGVVRFSHREWTLVLTYHHLILDGWSERIILRDFLAMYKAAINGTTLCLPTPLGFRDYVHWYEQQDYVADGCFWSERLGGFSEANQLCPPHAQSSRRATFKSDREVEYPAPLDAITWACRRLGITQNTVLQGVWALVVARYANTLDVVYGLVSSGRERGPLAHRDVAGLLVTTLPVRLQIDPRRKLSEWLTDFQEELVELRTHECPAVDWTRTSTSIGSQGHPLFQSVFIAVDFPPLQAFDEDVSKIEIKDVDFTSLPHFDLSIFFISGFAPRLRFVYEKRRFDKEAVERLAGAYLDLLDRVDLEGDMTLGDAMASLPL